MNWTKLTPARWPKPRKVSIILTLQANIAKSFHHLKSFRFGLSGRRYEQKKRWVRSPNTKAFARYFCWRMNQNADTRSPTLFDYFVFKTCICLSCWIYFLKLQSIFNQMCLNITNFSSTWIDDLMSSSNYLFQIYIITRTAEFNLPLNVLQCLNRTENIIKISSWSMNACLSARKQK